MGHFGQGTRIIDITTFVKIICNEYRENAWTPSWTGK